MNKPPNKLDTNSGEEDFTTSMARLAELAAQNIESNEKQRQKEQEDLDDDFREFMTAKRKAPQDTRWSVRLFGHSHKLHINPYVASGFLIILISAGFICAPRLSKYFEEKEAELERKKTAAAQIASQTEATLKNYTVFDAARDVSGSDVPLQTKSISELAMEVAEANEKFGSKLEVSWNFSNFNLAPESMTDSSTINSENEVEENIENASLPESENIILDEWTNTDLQLYINQEFKFEEQCVDPNLVLEEGGEEIAFRDVLLRIGAIGGNIISSESCS